MKNSNDIKNPKESELKALLTFLKQTKDGKYAAIDKDALQLEYARFPYLREEPIECVYIHSINIR